jgi:hypothetical protein
MEFWQAFRAPAPGEGGPWRDRYPAPLPDGTVLDMPLRDFRPTFFTSRG